jgi:hypothetical protein
MLKEGTAGGIHNRWKKHWLEMQKQICMEKKQKTQQNSVTEKGNSSIQIFLKFQRGSNYERLLF